MERIRFNDGWSVRRKANRFAELTGEAEPFKPVVLPHDARRDMPRSETESPATGFISGGSWEYQKTFAVPDSYAGKRLFLHFEGVYRDAIVTVNDARAGHRPSGYAGFTVRIDELVQPGTDAVIHLDVTSGDDSRWYPGGGIYRNVHLMVGDPIRIAVDGLRVTTTDLCVATATIEVAITVDNDGAEPAARSVSTHLLGPDGSVVAMATSAVTSWPGRPQVVRQRLTVAGPEPWSIESPTLYTCRVALSGEAVETDRASTSFGIRTLQLNANQGLRINGEPVKLRGACVHHDNGVIGAATIERADERRVELLKASGFNALRSAHNPMSEAMLDACDRIGMVVMDEAFDAWTETKSTHDYARYYETWWREDLRSMVAKDINHPSVIMYSLGNEIAETGRPDGARRTREMAEAVRELDPTRYVTCCINALHACGSEVLTAADVPPMPELGINSLMVMMQDYLPVALRSEVVDRRLAEAYGAVDIAGYNYLETCYDLDHERHPDRVIVGSETMPPLIGRHWPAIRDSNHVIGDFTWAGWEYLGEAGIGRIDREGTEVEGFGVAGRYPHIHAGTGDLDLTGHRKPVSYFREIVYGLRTDPFIAVEDPAVHGVAIVHQSPWVLTDSLPSWDWPGADGNPVTVSVYAEGDEVELIVDGESVGRRPAGEAAQWQASFDTVYRPGTIEAVAYRDSAVIGRTSLRTPTDAVELRCTPDRSALRADGTDLAFVTIALTDNDGIVHTSDDRQVTVDVDGAGVLAGLGSGAQSTEESYGDDACTTFQGRALAVIRPTGPGAITVNVRSSGLDRAAVRLTAG